MPNTISSTYMNLPVPVPTVQLGPQWATDINTCLLLIDQHTHNAGAGQPITPTGININTDLTFANHNATFLRSSRYQVQASPLATASDLGCVYISGVDLYYNDVNSNQIRLTQNGGVAGTPGSITGLVFPASVTYTVSNTTFTFQSTTATAANIDVGSVIIREEVANAKGITLSSPTGLPSNYTFTLPSSNGSSANQVLTNDGNGTGTWSPKSQYNILTKNSNYTIQRVDDIVFASSALTFTLTSSTGILGKQFILEKTFASTGLCPLNTLNSQTISGNDSGTLALATLNESITLVAVSTGYQILSHKTETGLVAYIPTITGFGTASSANMFWSRKGDSIHITGTFSTGTAQASIASISLPQVAVDGNKIKATTLVGISCPDSVGANYYTMLATSGASSVFFGVQGAGTAGLDLQNGNGVFNSNTPVSLSVDVPIVGWFA